jgi:hypothetical protein
MEETLKYPEKFKIVILNQKKKIFSTDLHSRRLLCSADY